MDPNETDVEKPEKRRGPKPITVTEPAPPAEGTAAFDLADNDLQRVLVTWKDSLAKYTGLLVAGAILLAVGLGYWLISANSARQTREAAWERLASAEVPEAYAAVADSYPGSEAAVWARLSEARSYLAEGVQSMFTDRPAAIERLESARKVAAQIADDENAPLQAREQAALYRAVALESMSDGDTSKAVQAYERYTKEYSGAARVAFAEQRIEELKRDDTAQFYAWFSEQNPTPAKPPEPNDGLDTETTPPAVEEESASKETAEETTSEDEAAEDATAEESPSEDAPAGDAADKPSE